jgi:hypothetical protein
MHKTILALLVLLTQVSCKEDPPVKPPDNGGTPKITLVEEDASCTEVWLSVKVDPLLSLAEINMLKDEELLFSITGTSFDTLLYVENLSPSTTYLYTVKVNFKEKEYSDSIAVVTLQPTSHNFTWQTFTFGDHSNSILRDVVVIDENNIYAVGTIYLNDSLGQPDPHPYTIAYWNGQNWVFKKIYDTNNQLIPSIRGINVFGLNNIWLADGGIHKWDGISEQANISFDRISLIGGEENGQSVNGFYGTNSDNLFGFGWKGMITKYNIDNWQKMQSGTTVDLLDIWGSDDGTIWACGYNSEDAFTVLLRYDGIQWNKIYEGSPDNQNNNEYIGPIAGVWTNSKFFTYVTNWAFIYTQPNKNTLDIKRITPWFSDVAFAIRGTNHNNIFIAGQHGLVGHFNGVTYQEITELKDEDEYLFKIDVKNNTAAAVGYNYQGIASRTAVVHIINHNK